MGYRERFLEVCRTGDWDAALAFLKAIFHDPAHQKVKGTPTDFISDGDDEKVTAAAGFDAMVEGFKPRETLDKRVEFLLECLGQEREEHEPRHTFQPFNTLAFKVGSYERCDVVVDSLHRRADGSTVQQFGLNHEIVHDSDSHEEYTFTYDLEYHPDQYTLMFEGEVVPGKLLHYDTKLVIFARWLVKLVGKLVVHETFARFPKTLPFRFLIVAKEDYGANEIPIELVPPVTADSLAGNPEREAWQDAAVLRGDTGIEARFMYHLPSLHRLDSEDGKQLVALLTEHAPLRQLVVKMGDAALARLQGGTTTEPVHLDEEDEDADEEKEMPPETFEQKVERAGRNFGPVTIARALRAAGDRAAALALEEKILRTPLPAAWPEERDRAMHVVEEELSRRFALWTSLSEDDRATLRAAWDACLAALREAARVEPFMALFLFERENAAQIDAAGKVVDPEDADDDASEDDVDDDDHREDEDDDLAAMLADDDGGDPAAKTQDDWPGSWLKDELENIPRWIRALGESPPAGYVELVLDVVRHAGPEMRGYGGQFDVIQHRLLALGPRAAVGLPEVLALGQRWAVRRNGYVDEQIAGYFGKFLMWMGLEDVPEFIHAAHRRNEYMMTEFYPRWAGEGPKRRLAKFIDGFRADPARFDDAQAWEAVIYDSEPGIKMLVHAIVGSKKEKAQVELQAVLPRLVAAARAPGPLLTKVIYALADHFAGKQWPHARALLEVHPSLDAERAETLRRARIVEVITALDGTGDVAAKVAQLRAHYPDHPMPRFLEARYVLERDGAGAAAAYTRDALRELAKDDLVYRKAVFQYAGVPLDRWDELAPAATYAYLRIALERYRDKHYDDGVFDGRKAGLDKDPWYETFEDVISAYTPDQLREVLAGWATELEFSGVLRNANDEALCKHVDEKQWPITWVIAQRLAATPGSEPWRLETLLGVWASFAEDEERRRSLAKLLWPIESWRERIVVDERVRPHLPWWIDDSPGSTTLEVARGVFAALRAAGHPERVTELAATLDNGVVVNTFLSIAPAFQATRDFAGGAALLAKILAATSPKKPDYVLIAGNLAAFQMQGGLAAECEATLEALFALDWSRFDYKPNADHASFAKAVLGGDLDAQYTKAFRIYFGMAKFNAACLYAQTQRAEKSVAALREAIQLNPTHYTADKLVAEADFAPLRDHAAFRSLITELGGAA